MRARGAVRSALGVFLGMICLARGGRDRQVLCHYLPWFTINATADYAQARRGWCGVGAAVTAAECADTGAERRRQYTGEGPLIGEYSQREPAVLQYHLLLAQASTGRHCHSIVDYCH